MTSSGGPYHVLLHGYYYCKRKEVFTVAKMDIHQINVVVRDGGVPYIFNFDAANDQEQIYCGKFLNYQTGEECRFYYNQSVRHPIFEAGKQRIRLRRKDYRKKKSLVLQGITNFYDFLSQQA